jgi:hypothetical protein
MDSDLPPIPGAVLPINFNAYNTVQQAMLVDKPQFTNVLETHPSSREHGIPIYTAKTLKIEESRNS